EVYPRGLYELLMRVKEEFGNIPMYVTENGAAFDDRLEGETVHDLKRIEYIGSYLKNVSEALHEGANVKGYFVWSLMDNFEWAFGFSKRFGLVYVDFPTEKRIIKDSGHYYADLIKTRKL
ncbi:MAG TPA: family 1 glycosylhydrolase, partial [Spirochaetia bacterium]|nr:family 1 glycosylhydrolase [Spirochaetia bacterium]